MRVGSGMAMILLTECVHFTHWKIMRKSARNSFPGKIMKAYMCVICGFVYDESKGLPDQGIPPGTKWEDVPENFTCPDCGASKADFEMVEI